MIDPALMRLRIAPAVISAFKVRSLPTPKVSKKILVAELTVPATVTAFALEKIKSPEVALVNGPKLSTRLPAPPPRCEG